MNTQSLHHRDVVNRHGRVVILVEDDAGLRSALERVLRASGFEAQAYADAEAALADHSVEWADCLVIDLNLPAISGLDLLEHLRGRGVMAPAVVISAQDQDRIRQEVERRSAARFLPKPFLGSALVRVLDDVIGSAETSSSPR